MSADNDELLNDVLNDVLPPGFRETALEGMLQHSRRRRSRRRITQSLATLAIIAAVVWSALPRRPLLFPEPVQIVRTQPMASTRVIVTGSLPPVTQVRTQHSVTVVRTWRGGFRMIGDQQLFALAAPRQLALVRNDTGHEQLVWLDPPRRGAE